MVLGVSLAYFTLVYVQNLDVLDLPSGDTEAWTFIFIPLFAFLGSRMIFKQILHKGNESTQLKKPGQWEDHFASYQTACLVRWAILEGAAFILIFLKPEFVLFGVLLILYMAFLRPSQEELKRELGV